MLEFANKSSKAFQSELEACRNAYEFFMWAAGVEAAHAVEVIKVLKDAEILSEDIRRIVQESGFFGPSSTPEKCTKVSMFQ
jgi:hypothetical protein